MSGDTRGGRHEISDGCTAARSVAHRRRLRWHERTPLRSHGTAATSKRGRSRCARSRICVGPWVLPLRGERIRVGRWAVRAPAAAARPLGRRSLATGSPRLVLGRRALAVERTRHHGGKEERRQNFKESLFPPFLRGGEVPSVPSSVSELSGKGLLAI